MGKVDLTAPVCDAPDFQSRIEYDIEAACARQRVFNYQVSLPYFSDMKFLTEAVERYKFHLNLKQQNPELCFVPCYDFDLIWHAHQLYPFIYTQDTTEIQGEVYNHNDSVNDLKPGSQLIKAEIVTREKWKNLGHNLHFMEPCFVESLHLVPRKNPLITVCMQHLSTS